MNLTLCFVAAGALLILVSDFLRFRPAPKKTRPLPRSAASYPSVSIIRPVRGLDVGAEANLIAALDLEYPGEVETLLVFDDASDPAYPVLERIARERRALKHEKVRLLVAGPPPANRTGKLNAMMVGLAAARGELIAFNDSDTRPQKSLLRALVDSLLATPGAADAFAPALVAEAPRTAGDVGYAMMMNAWYGPAALRFAQRNNGLPFIMGQFMVWRREALDAIGGLGSVEGQLVDDMALGRCAAAVGYRNILIDEPLHIFTGGMGPREFWHLAGRWLVFSRNGLPWRFVWEQSLRGVTIWTAIICLIAAIFTSSPLALALSAAALVVASAGQFDFHTRFGGAPIPRRYFWVPVGLVVLTPFVLLVSVVRRRVDWRGRSYALALKADLTGREAEEHRPVSV